MSSRLIEWANKWTNVLSSGRASERMVERPNERINKQANKQTASERAQIHAQLGLFCCSVFSLTFVVLFFRDVAIAAVVQKAIRCYVLCYCQILHLIENRLVLTVIAIHRWYLKLDGCDIKKIVRKYLN